MQDTKLPLFTKRKILIVDDHRNIRMTLRYTLEAEGALIEEADTVALAFSKLQSFFDGKASMPYDAILLDIRLPDGNGLDILKRISENGASSRVIMISGEGTAGEAFQATQMGAFDYVEKPFATERILVTVRRCIDFNKMRVANEDLSKKVNRGREIIGNHPKISEMMAIVARVGPTNGRVLIVGESGSGKELVARAIHMASERADKPLIKVNCAAIPATLIESELFGHEKGAFTGAVKARRGLFEQADGGTLFLDEIGELSGDVQAKLLRVLQSGELIRLGSEETVHVDVRLLTATHRDLTEMVHGGEFREDLFYRLNVVTIQVPALRERVSDIPGLAHSFLEQACEENSIGGRTLGSRAIEQLKAYSWPGNVRELRNLMERIAILSEEETIDWIEELAEKHEAEKKPDTTAAAPKPAAQGDLFTFESGVSTWQDFHQKVDHDYVVFVLKKASGNVSEAARILCLERAYLHRLMKKLGIHRDVVVYDG